MNNAINYGTGKTNERNFGKRILYSSGDFEYFGFLNGFYTGEGENAI